MVGNYWWVCKVWLVIVDGLVFIGGLGWYQISKVLGKKVHQRERRSEHKKDFNIIYPNTNQLKRIVAEITVLFIFQMTSDIH